MSLAIGGSYTQLDAFSCKTDSTQAPSILINATAAALRVLNDSNIASQMDALVKLQHAIGIEEVFTKSENTEYLQVAKTLEIGLLRTILNGKELKPEHGRFIAFFIWLFQAIVAWFSKQPLNNETHEEIAETRIVELQEMGMQVTQLIFSQKNAERDGSFVFWQKDCWKMPSGPVGDTMGGFKKKKMLKSVPLARVDIGLITRLDDPADIMVTSQEKRIGDLLKQAPRIITIHCNERYWNVEHSRWEQLLIEDFAPKGNLAEVLGNAHKLSNPEKLKLVLDVFEGVAGMHERGILHNDIHQLNIVCMEENGLYRGVLIDFGLSSFITESSEEQKAKEMQSLGLLVHLISVNSKFPGKIQEKIDELVTDLQKQEDILTVEEAYQRLKGISQELSSL